MPTRPHRCAAAAAVPEAARSRARRWRIGLVVAALVFGLAGATVDADSYDDRRMRTAARLMRALLAAHEPALPADAVETPARRVLVLGSDAGFDAELGALIAPPGSDSGVRVDSAMRHDPEATPPAAIFLAKPLDDEDFARLLAWCIAHGVILYSPFEGDVERGATAGVSVQAKVQPFLNLGTLEASGVRLRRFYLDHSRVLP